MPTASILDLPFLSATCRVGLAVMEEQLAVNRYCDLRTLGDDKLRNYVFGLTTSSKELNPKNFFGNSALHRVKSSGNTRHSFPAS